MPRNRFLDILNKAIKPPASKDEKTSATPKPVGYTEKKTRQRKTVNK